MLQYHLMSVRFCHSGVPSIHRVLLQSFRDSSYQLIFDDRRYYRTKVLHTGFIAKARIKFNAFHCQITTITLPTGLINLISGSFARSS
jgi:hypothetical protein